MIYMQMYKIVNRFVINQIQIYKHFSMLSLAQLKFFLLINIKVFVN